MIYAHLNFINLKYIVDPRTHCNEMDPQIPPSIKVQPLQNTDMEPKLPQSTETQSVVQSGASPIPDGYRTPPCEPHPQRWNFDYGPVLAPDIVKFHYRLMVPKFENGHCLDLIAIADSEPCGNKEHGNDEPNWSLMKDSIEVGLNLGAERNHLNGYDRLDGGSAGCSFEGPRKRSSKFMSKDPPQNFLSDNICGAFKCIKMRKQA
jgi:hypothetical protein